MDIEIEKRIHSSRFDGGNGMAVCSEIGALYRGQSGGNLMLTTPDGQPYTIAAGTTVAWTIDPASAPAFGLVGLWTDDELVAAAYRPAPRVGRGSAAIPGSVAGGPQTVSVTIAPPMPTSTYEVVERLRGLRTLIGGHSITDVVITDGDTVVVHVDTEPGTLDGATVHLTAHTL